MKILLTDLAYFYHNYGAQGILLPFLEIFSKQVDAEFSVTISETKYLAQDLQYAEAKDFNLYQKPRINISTFLSTVKHKKHKEFKELVKNNDVIIDLSGIEFIGNLPIINKWKNLINTLYTQKLAKRYKKKYYKYTKSYGPFQDYLYNFFVSKYLNKLPFLQVRGKNNLKEVNKLNIKIPVKAFPDISLALKPADTDWADNYLKRVFPNISKKIFGISPSVVIRSIKSISGKITGEDHVKLCKQIITKYCEKGQSVLLIPHSIGNGRNLSNCDLALARKIYNEMGNLENLFILDDFTLSYSQVRAIIGLLDFYVTSRYHSVASALNMSIPVISLSWHIKYKDIMSLYLNDFLVIDCRENTIQQGLRLIEQYYLNRKWYDKKMIKKSQHNIEQQIDESIKMIIDDIKR